MIKMIVIFFFAWSQAALAQDAARNAEQRFHVEIVSITDAVEAKKLAPAEGAREMLLAAKAYFPNDLLTHAYYESVLNYAERFDRNEITRDHALELFSIRTERYNEALKKRTLDHQQHQQADEQQQQQERARLEYLAAQEQDAARNRAMIGGALQGIGGAFRNAYGRPSVNCSTTSMPGVLTTNCR